MGAELIEEIGKYRIIGELGHGGMGLVYLAEDKNLGRQVALKLLLGNFASDELFKQRFRQEARSISSIVHPNVVQIHSMDEIDGHLIIDIEYVEGQPLSDILRSHPITPDWLAHITRDVLEGLEVCHDIGVIHRDIKPSNILMTLNGQAKIADFGIAKALADSGAMSIEESHSTTVFLGTPRFTPPEAWDGLPAKPSWDLYSLGILLYEALTRRPAFQSNTMLSLMKEINTTQLAPIETKVEGISPQFAGLINDLIKADPAERIPSAKEALLRLKDAKELHDGIFLDENTVTIPIPKPLTTPLKPPKATDVIVQAPRGILIPILLIGVVLIGIALIIGQITSNQAQLDTTPPVAKNLSPLWIALNIKGGDSKQWHLLSDTQGEGAPTVLLGYHDFGLMYLNVTQQEEHVLLKGEWAERITMTGNGFRSGDVQGRGVRHKDGYTFVLTFRNHSDHSTIEETYHLKQDSADTTSRTFVENVEKSEWLPALLHYEIFPRTLPIGEYFDALLPWDRTQRVVAPFINEATIPQIDGQLDEALWTERYYSSEGGRIGEMSALEGEGNEKIFTRFDGEKLYFAIKTPLQSDTEVGLDFSIRSIVENPTSSSQRGELNLSSHGVKKNLNYIDGVENRLTTPWEFNAHTEATSWSVEWSVPVEMAEALSKSARVRFVAILWERDPTGKKKIIAEWGAPNINQVEHGAIVMLGKEK